MGISLRAAQASDLDALHAVQRRVEQHDGIAIATPREEFEEWLDDPHLDLAHDTRVAETAGAVVAFGQVRHMPSGAREERAHVAGAVDPAHRRHGYGSAILSWQIARATELLRATTEARPEGTAELPRFVRCHAYEFQVADLALFAQHGLRPVRYFDELLCDLGSIPLAEAVPGISIVPWDSSRSEEARIAQNEAFSQSWGSTARDAAAWEHMVAAFGSRLDLSFFALEAGRIVGVCRNMHYPGDEAVTGRRDGWIAQLSVLRSHRKRGIASALIVASLETFRRVGFTHSMLGVDSENEAGAVRLYERLGYRRARRTIVHERRV